VSDRYYTDRFQPDKSIDLVDEACARLRLEQESKPEVLWNIERNLMTEQEDDEVSKVRRDAVAKEVQDLKKKADRVTKVWQEESGEGIAESTQSLGIGWRRA
jgi:ATP-dependent Clp protease ATP-binding subunit ClpB